MFFDNWFGLSRVLVVGPLAYLALVLMLRVSGNRTLSKMNAFDLIVTVALGSTLATVLLTEKVALAEGVLAFAVLVGLQYAITWLSARSRFVVGLVKAEPALLVYRGRILGDAMRRQRVIEADLLQAMRGAGASRLDEVEAVVLETDGSFSVMTSRSGTDELSALANVPGAGEPRDSGADGRA